MESRSLTGSWGKIARVAAVGAFVAGCSVDDYETPISSFAASTGEASNALAALDREVTAQYTEYLRAQILDGTRIVILKSGDCQIVGSKRCRLHTEMADDPRVQIFPPEPLLGNFVTLMVQVDRYAKGLSEILNAETTDKVSASVNSALGSVENLAVEFDNITNSNFAKPVSAFAAPIGQAINYGVGVYVKKLQVEALRHAVAQADPVIGRIAKRLETVGGQTIVLGNKDALENLDNAYVSFEEAWDDDPEASGAKLASLVKAAGFYDRVLTTKPSEVFIRLGKAHSALNAALNSPDASSATMLARIEAFAVEARKISDIVKEFEQAREELEE